MKKCIVEDNKKIYKDNNILIQFINESTLDDIKNNLLNLMHSNEYCKPVDEKYDNKNSKIIGEGYIGKVYTSSILKTEKIRLGEDEITLPVAVKETKISTPELNFDILENKLYISGNDNLSTEALILLYTNKLWEMKKIPHLQYMFGYNMCSNTKNINKIIIEKYGFEYNYEQQIYLFSSTDIFWPQQNKKNNTIFTSSLNTLDELFKYIRFNEVDDSVKLPNGIVCNVSTLFDYLCISFLHTYNSLVENNITVFDLHPSNIFINWLTTNCWFGNKNIKDVRYIYYKINDKMYKIETFGFIIKIGDLGMSIIKPRDDVYIIGQGYNLSSNYKSYELLTQPNISAFDFIGWNSQLLPEYWL